jgi:peptidoglycan/xylan/chitin deacetylase (PgdA/CDA1 family)
VQGRPVDPPPSEQHPLPSSGGDDAGTPPPVVTTDSGVDSGTAPPSPPPPTSTCGEPPAEPPSTTTPLPVGDFAVIRHWEQPRVDNVVALTFDDGPNPATTNRILDTLAAEKIRATFFINTRATLDLRSSSEAQKTFERILADGHVVGNHTANHYELSKTSTDVEAQLKTVEDDVRALFPCAPRLTLVRAPFGQPYLSGTDEEQARVFPIVAKHGVHIGWSIEALDWTCDSAACVTDRVLRRIDLGRRGAILMHDTQVHTADALPTLITELRKRGVTFVTAEKLVRDKYGKTSAELVK